MIFTSASFFFFFIGVFLIHWYIIPVLVPEKYRLRTLHVFLLIASYFFYMSWNWKFGFLMLLSTLIDYAAGLRLAFLQNDPSAKGQRLQKIALIISLVSNLGILSYFKYADFFISSFVDLADTIAPGSFGTEGKESLLLHVILPLGISFFTFQSMSYTIDVYRKVIPAEKSFVRFALFVSFFPQLVAGPIVTAKDFLPQLTSMPVFDLERMRVAARWFLLGYIKKAILADNMAPIVDTIYANPEHYGAAGHWLGAVAFWIQVYNDFSGYSDMAIGSAIFIGYTLPVNFELPYLSTSVSEHWRRWHISLMIWLRDYLYIPLGGNRVSPLRHMINQFLTMFVAGLWHGANWTFVIWGSIHGLLLILEGKFRKLFKKGKNSGGNFWLSTLPGFITTSFITLFFGTMFRSQTIQDSFLIMKRMLGAAPEGVITPGPDLYRNVLLGFLVMLLGHTAGYFIFIKKTFRFTPPPWIEVASIPVLILILSQLSASGAEAFIYFVF